MSVSKCCRFSVGHHNNGYFTEVWCKKCGQELSDTEVIDDLSLIDGDGEDD